MAERFKAVAWKAAGVRKGSQRFESSTIRFRSAEQRFGFPPFPHFDNFGYDKEVIEEGLPPFTDQKLEN